MLVVSSILFLASSGSSEGMVIMVYEYPALPACLVIPVYTLSSPFIEKTLLNSLPVPNRHISFVSLFDAFIDDIIWLNESSHTPSESKS